VQGEEEEQRVLHNLIDSDYDASSIQAELTTKATRIHSAVDLMLDFSCL